ncbi:MAG: tetratricopeptide repeat protein, partial [Thermodesulfobacteriota bacterium]|nr:tetratricopeptide repeat protein [Thermodesulfobacteriota bacterium]
MPIINLTPETHLSSRRRNIFAILAIIILVLSVYSNTFNASWHFDDDQNILELGSMRLNKLCWPEIKKTFFNEQGAISRPVVRVTLALNYYFGKTNVFGYHLVNISIHIVASIFLFLLIYNTLNLPLLKDKYGTDSYFIAFLATVFWAINPVQTQAVTYIVQRMASMAGMFYIMSMYFYLKGRTSQKGRLKAAHFILCLICALFAFGSKENTAMLPFSIFLFDLLLIQGITKKIIRKNVWVFLALILIPLALALVLKGPSFFYPQKFLSGYEPRPFTLVQRLLTEPRIVLFYISLLLYPMPTRLSICHDIAISKNLIDPPMTIIAISLIVIVLFVTVIKCKKWPFICYCIMFFFLNHLIEGSVFPLELIFEHRNYIPAMLLFVPIAILLSRGIRHFSYKKTMKLIMISFVVLLLIGIGNSTFLRNFVWKTEGTLWADAVEKAPELIRPHLNLGNFYSSVNMADNAIAEYKAAIFKTSSVNKTDKYLNYYNIGLEHQHMGNYDKALRYYNVTENNYPSHADTHNNKAIILVKQGLLKEAEHAFRLAIKYDANSIIAQRNFALLLLKDNRIDEAIEHLERAYIISPDDAQTLAGLGYAYRLTGSNGRAFFLFDKSIHLKNHDPKVRLYLAEIYYRSGRDAQAEKSIQEFVGH